MAESTISHDKLARRGLMFILSSPSGAGKTTISRMLLAADEEIRLSVSVTTRPPRPGEIDGTHYYFVDDAEFDRMVEEDDFYEWAHVFGHRYGTPKGRKAPDAGKRPASCRTRFAQGPAWQCRAHRDR